MFILLSIQLQLHNILIHGHAYCCLFIFSSLMGTFIQADLFTSMNEVKYYFNTVISYRIINNGQHDY